MSAKKITGRVPLTRRQYAAAQTRRVASWFGCSLVLLAWAGALVAVVELARGLL